VVCKKVSIWPSLTFDALQNHYGVAHVIC